MRKQEETINYAEKGIRDAPLHRMFTAVPRRYDLVNHVITWGFDKRWRWKAARECFTSPSEKLLDLCCGTGDLVINMARLAKDGVELAALDYSQPMLTIATKKASILAGGKKITFVYGDAANLPFSDGYFDCIGISFALRNLTYKNPLARQHIAEVLRVLNRGGRFVIVETSQPKTKLIRKLFHLYLRRFVFMIGYRLSGNRGAYSYLVESAARFYSADELKQLLMTAGFRQVSFRPVFFGTVGICVAVK